MSVDSQASETAAASKAASGADESKGGDAGVVFKVPTADPGGGGAPLGKREPIAVRSARINHFVLGIGTTARSGQASSQHRDESAQDDARKADFARSLVNR